MDEYDNECDTEMVSLDSLLLLQCVEFLKYLFVLIVDNFKCHLWSNIRELLSFWD